MLDKYQVTFKWSGGPFKDNGHRGFVWVSDGTIVGVKRDPGISVCTGFDDHLIGKKMADLELYTFMWVGREPEPKPEPDKDPWDVLILELNKYRSRQVMYHNDIEAIPLKSLPANGYNAWLLSRGREFAADEIIEIVKRIRPR